jgi:hypothetical protein
VTVRAKAGTVPAVLVFANLAVFGAREILGALYDPIVGVWRVTGLRFYWIWFKLGRAYWRSRHLWTLMAYLESVQGTNIAPRPVSRWVTRWPRGSPNKTKRTRHESVPADPPSPLRRPRARDARHPPGGRVLPAELACRRAPVARPRHHLPPHGGSYFYRLVLNEAAPGWPPLPA